jgi:hypothetical protein
VHLSRLWQGEKQGLNSNALQVNDIRNTPHNQPNQAGHHQSKCNLSERLRFGLSRPCYIIATFEEINRESSCKERFRQTIILRGVFIYTANNQFEVGDYTLNGIIGTQLNPFGNVDEIRVNPLSINYDYLNWSGEDTADEIRQYLPSIQSFAIDISVTFAREYDACRNPPELI